MGLVISGRNTMFRLIKMSLRDYSGAESTHLSLILKIILQVGQQDKSVINFKPIFVTLQEIVQMG